MTLGISHPQLEPNYGGQSRADELISWLREYADKRINSRMMDKRRAIPPHIILDFGNRGVLGMTAEQRHGGLGLSYRDCFRVYEQLASIDTAIACMISTHEFLATRAIYYGAEETQAACLPLLASGRSLGAFAFTELTTASSPKGLHSKAMPNGRGGWELNGSKTWISSGNWGGIISVYVQQCDERGQPCGFSGFVLQQGMPGLRAAQEAMTMGMRAPAQNVLELQGVQVGPEHLLGQLGRGMDFALDVMMMGRIGFGAICLGGTKRCLQLMARFASRRQVSTGLLLENPVTQVRMNELTAEVTAFEIFLYFCGDSLDLNLPLPEAFCSACKVVGSELFCKATDTLMQLAGSRGFMETNGIPQLYRDARVFRIAEGPSEALIMHIGSTICNRGEPLYQFMEQYLGCPEVVSALRSAILQLQDTLNTTPKFTDRHQNLRWVHSCAGEFVIKAMVWAACSSALRQQASPDLSLKLAESWAKNAFESYLQELIHKPVKPLGFSLVELIRTIDGFTQSIGDVQQSLPGEDWSLDPLLCKEGLRKKGLRKKELRKEELRKEELLKKELLKKEPNLKENVPQKNGNQQQQNWPAEQNIHHQPSSNSNSQQSKELVRWIQDWISRVLKIPPQQLDAQSAFADLGLDSVTSVELIAGLEKHLGCCLDETLLWNYPTISRLVDYLLSDAPLNSSSVKERRSSASKLLDREV